MVKNMKKKILNIGSVTKDTIIRNNNEYTQIGGAVYYQSSTLNTLKIDNTSIILIGEDGLEMISDFDLDNDIHKIITKDCMKYTNIYLEDNTRIQKAYFPKYRIKIEDIEKLNIKADEYSQAILSPLSPYEIDAQLIRYLKKADIETTLVIQGYIRQLDKDNNVIARKWDNYREYLKYTDIISSDEYEFKTAFNVEISTKNMKKFIEDNSLKIVIITQASDGSTIYTKDEKIKIPAIKTKKEVDPTGLGDTYITSFISKKDETTLFNAGIYAAICSKNKLENKGVLKTSKNKIEKEYHELLNKISQNNKRNNNGQ